MTDTTTARRQLLALLLDRMDRDALLPAEKPLLRCLVAAEQGAADVPKQRHWRGTDGADIGTPYMDAQAALARVREYATSRVAGPDADNNLSASWVLNLLDGPSPTPDDTPTTGDDASDIEIVHTNDIPTDWANGFDSRCSARYTGPPPGIDVKWGARSDYRCDLRVHARGTDHAVRLGSGPFSWTDDVAVWPTDNAPPEQPQGIIDINDTRRRAGCGPTPAWMPDDSRPCPTQFTDGDCAGTWQHPGDCTTNADDIPSTQEIDAPSEPQP